MSPRKSPGKVHIGALLTIKQENGSDPTKDFDLNWDVCIVVKLNHERPTGRQSATVIDACGHLQEYVIIDYFDVWE